MALKISFHGGKCCGIRHIYGFTFWPFQKSFEPELLANDEFESSDRYGHDVHSATNVFHKAAPAEPLYERLDRYIKFLREFRPGGVVEVCLAKKKGDFDQIAMHEAELFKHGFHLVTELPYNSNSKNVIRIYHLVMTVHELCHKQSLLCVSFTKE